MFYFTSHLANSLNCPCVVRSLSSWLDDMEKQVQLLAMPALRPEQIVQQQDKNEVTSYAGDELVAPPVRGSMY